MAEHMTKSAFARHLGVTPARVSHYVKSGMPVTDEGRVDPVVANAWVSENIARPNDGGDSGASALMAARIRSTNALANLREFDLSVKRGRYVSRAAIEASLADLSGRYAHQLALALHVPVAEAAAALNGIAARIMFDARLGLWESDDGLFLENDPHD